MVLVDTPVWSLALRRRTLAPADEPVRARLAGLIQQGHARILGVVRQELLSGIREPQQFEQVRNYLRALPDVPLSTEDHESAARLNNQCRAQGVAGSLVDFLICAVALRRGWQVFTTDQDFERYAKFVPLKLLAR